MKVLVFLDYIIYYYLLLQPFYPKQTIVNPNQTGQIVQTIGNRQVCVD